MEISQEPSSGHSGSRSHPRRRAREGAQAQTTELDETRGQLRNLQEEFARFRDEHTARPRVEQSTLVRAPFTADVMAQPYPLDLQIQGNRGYDGRTDPEVHVNDYFHNMSMMGVSDAVMCRALYSTLSGRAAEWFRTLQPGSIADFNALAIKFVRKFITSKAVKKSYMYLEKAKQLEGESLVDFLVKWKAPVGEVEQMDDATATHMLHISLRSGYLYQDFILHPPSSYEEALRRVTDYANAGEANAVKRSQEVGSSSRKPTGRAEIRSDDDRSRSRNRPGPFTALNRSAAEAMQYAQSCNLIKLPHPGRDRPDKSKHCAYHRCAVHDTEECVQLRQLLEELLNSGKLDKCVGRREEGNKETDRRDRRRSHRRSDRSERDDRVGSGPSG
ncbi:PREDICTED: uncharacterized protein LOC109153504 [Ipomoea nil]|uniref:uncharacterized protein LOC109153504 n=1 Tax=Ipomoea nil TaxID=35883 RepID=UPI000901FBA2|nr:PREDICTED: uncharacterized protein LOC109153504 [Ipomoea nil]